MRYGWIRDLRMEGANIPETSRYVWEGPHVTKISLSQLLHSGVNETEIRPGYTFERWPYKVMVLNDYAGNGWDFLAVRVTRFWRLHLWWYRLQLISNLWKFCLIQSLAICHLAEIAQLGVEASWDWIYAVKWIKGFGRRDHDIIR